MPVGGTGAGDAAPWATQPVHRLARRAVWCLGVTAVSVGAVGCAPGALDPDAIGESATPADAPTASPTPSPAPAPSAEPVVLQLSAMGDWLPHDSVVADAVVPGGYDFAQFFDTLQPRYAESDLVYCNQEVPTAGEQLGVSYYPEFNAPNAMAAGMQDAGCDVIGLANNHMADQGQQGIDITRGLWDDLDPALLSGANRDEAEQLAPSVTTIDGVDVGFVALTDLSNGVAEPWALNRLDDTELVESLMGALDDASDVQIVAVHWGDEYSTAVNDRQRELAQWLVDLGADVILGTHPHVLQPGEWIERADGTRAFVYYSLGNALSTQMEVPRLLAAVAQIEIVVGPAGDVTVQEPSAIPIYMHFDLTPAQFTAGEWWERQNLQVLPIADAADAIARSAWVGELTVESGIAFVTDVLGPDVTITP